MCVKHGETMAKIFKRKKTRSKFYYYRVYGDFVNAKGKHVKEKLRCTFKTDKKAAKAVADGHASAEQGRFNVDDLFTMLLDRLDAMPQKDRDKRRVDFGNRLLRLQAESLPFADAWAKWMSMPNKSRRGTPSANTLTGYRAIWKRLEKWATEKKLVNLHEMGRKHAEDYTADLWKSGVTERTYGAHIKFLRAVFRVLRLQAGIVENPFTELTIPELQRIRLGSIESVEVSDELINLMATEPRFCSHLHLPLQAGSDHILKLMNRHYTLDEFKQLVKTHNDLHHYAELSWQANEDGDKEKAMQYFNDTYNAFSQFDEAINKLQKKMQQLGYNDITAIVAFEK